MEKGFMITRLRSFWFYLRNSFWFVPMALALAGVGIAFLSLLLDKSLDSDIHGWYYYSGGLEGARSMLSTVAGSMITVAGVTFSITMVALTLASSQLGPRLLRNYMRDKHNQVVLGFFIAIYLYCLVVLQSLENQSTLPHISVNIAMILVMVSAGVFIYFIHHISNNIQADHAIALVFEDIKEIFNKRYEIFNDSYTRSEEGVRPNYTRSYVLCSDRNGYIKDIDIKALINFAIEIEGYLELKYRADAYVLQGKPLLNIYTDMILQKEQIDDLKEAFILGKNRASDQDIEFAFTQLVEIALRALSPGINDQYTAIACIDRLSSALKLYFENGHEAPYIYDEKGNLRLIEAIVTFHEIVDLSFNQIRQAGQNNPAIVIRLLERIADVACYVQNLRHKEALRCQATIIRDSAHRLIKVEYDLRNIDRCYEKVLIALGDKPRSNIED